MLLYGNEIIEKQLSNVMQHWKHRVGTVTSQTKAEVRKNFCFNLIVNLGQAFILNIQILNFSFWMLYMHNDKPVLKIFFKSQHLPHCSSYFEQINGQKRSLRLPFIK